MRASLAAGVRWALGRKAPDSAAVEKSLEESAVFLFWSFSIEEF